MSASDAAAPVETMWQGRFITAKRQGKWEFVSRSRGIKAAVILAVDDAADGRHVLLVEQYRVPLGKPTLELPAGLVGDDVAGEDPLLAAGRELEEETGYRAERLENLGDFYSSPGMVTESFTLVGASGLTRIGDGGGVEGEDITVHRVPLSGIEAFIAGKRAAGFAIDVRMLLLLAASYLR